MVSLFICQLAFAGQYNALAEPVNKILLFYGDRAFHWDVTYRVNQRDAFISSFLWHDRGFHCQQLAVEACRKEPLAHVALENNFTLVKPFWTSSLARPDVTKFIRNGQFELVGAHSQPTVTYIDSEVQLRTIIYGRLFTEAIIGKEDQLRLYWGVDYGPGNQTPQMLLKCGYDILVLEGWQRKFEPYYTEGIDGSRIFTATAWVDPDTTPLPKVLDENTIKPDFQKYLEDIVAQKPDFKYIGGKPANAASSNTEYNTAVQAAKAARIWNATHNDSEIIIGIRKYFHHLYDKAKDKVAEVQKLGHTSGGMLTHMEHKLANRLASNTVIAAERWATIANLLGAKYPEGALDKVWRQLMHGSHHDSINGSHNNYTYMDLLQQYRDANEAARKTLDGSLQYIASGVNTSNSGERIPLVVFNSLTKDRDEICQATIEFKGDGVNGFFITGSKGKPVPAQLMHAEKRNGRIISADVLFRANDLPSFGYATYYAVPDDKPPQTYKPVPEANFIETELYRIVVDPDRGGGIVSLYDKRVDRELIDTEKGVGNEFVTIEAFNADYPHGNLWGAPPTGVYGSSRNSRAEVKVFSGPLASRILVTAEVNAPTTSFGAKPLCKRVQEIIAIEGVPVIYFSTAILSHTGEPYQYVCVNFPLKLNSPKGFCEVRSGVLPVKLAKDYLDSGDGHHGGWRFKELGSDDYGVAMLNRGNRPSTLYETGITTTLMRSCVAAFWHREGASEYAPRNFLREAGNHLFFYALYPHKGDWRQAASHRRGMEYNFPLIAVQTDSHSGPLPLTQSFLKIEPSNVILSTLKPLGYPLAAHKSTSPDASKGLVIRVYETYGQDTEAKIILFNGIRAVFSTNMLEERQNVIKKTFVTSQGASGFRDNISHFAIETYEVIPSPVPAKAKMQVGAKIGEEKEPIQPVYNRFWRYSAGDAPLGNSLVGVYIFPVKQEPQKAKVMVINSYTDRTVAGTVKLSGPPGWTFKPGSTIDCNVEPISEQIFEIEACGSGAGIITAQFPFEGQIFEDTCEILDEFDGVQVEKPRLDGHQIIVTVDNPYRQPISGHISLVTPFTTWPRKLIGDYCQLEVAPLSKSFIAGPGESENVTFGVNVPPNAPEGTYWAVAKLCYAGHLKYSPILDFMANKDKEGKVALITWKGPDQTVPRPPQKPKDVFYKEE